MSDWDASTESPFIAGANLPDAGLPVTLVGIRTSQMDKREGTGQETVYIGSFSDSPQEWVINKTGRRFLRETCGVTNQNVQGPLNIPLTLYPNQTNMGVGIRPVQRVVQVAAPPPVQPTQPSQLANTQPAPVAQVPLGVSSSATTLAGDMGSPQQQVAPQLSQPVEEPPF